MTLVFNVYTKTTLSMQLNLNMFGNSCTENASFSSILSEVPFFYFNLLIWFKVNFKFGFILLRYIVIHCCCFFIWIIIQSSKNKGILWLDFPLRFHTIFFYCLENKFISLTFHWTLEKYGLIFFFTKLLIINVFQKDHVLIKCGFKSTHRNNSLHFWFVILTYGSYMIHNNCLFFHQRTNTNFDSFIVHICIFFV